MLKPIPLYLNWGKVKLGPIKIFSGIHSMRGRVNLSRTLGCSFTKVKKGQSWWLIWCFAHLGLLTNLHGGSWEHLNILFKVLTLSNAADKASMKTCNLLKVPSFLWKQKCIFDFKRHNQITALDTERFLSDNATYWLGDDLWWIRTCARNTSWILSSISVTKNWSTLTMTHPPTMRVAHEILGKTHFANELKNS